jgi:8-oxo-dGTP pyrophosphatase MutT (NUDIX family)
VVRTIERDIASAIIISSDQKILLGRKDPTTGAVYADGSWLIPGGGIEPGESSLEAMRREVMEETSLDVSAYQTVLVEDKATSQAKKTLDTGEKVVVKMKFFTYRVDINALAAAIPTHPSDELPTLEWVAMADLGNHKLPSPSMELFIKLGILS